MSGRTWMIYGAYGATGRRLAVAARQRGLSPLLGGRDRQRLETLARELELEFRVFGLDDAQAVDSALRGVHLLLNAAGPFEGTAAPLLESCLRQACHYLDTAVEIDALEHVLARDTPIRRAGIVACPGLSFAVTATECLALALAQALPGARRLMLAVRSPFTELSAGSAWNTVDGLSRGGRIRRDGRLEAVPLTHQVRQVDFGDGPEPVVTVPWGGLANAFHSTGIPDMEAYLSTDRRRLSLLRAVDLARPLVRIPLLARLARRKIAARLIPPSTDSSLGARAWVWGEVTDVQGASRSGRLRTADGREVTVEAALAVVAKLLKQPHPPGAYTPGQLMGWDFITTLPGSSPFEIEPVATG